MLDFLLESLIYDMQLSISENAECYELNTEYMYLVLSVLAHYEKLCRELRNNGKN